MDLNSTTEGQAFRRKVRQFVDANLPPDLADKVRDGRRLGKDDCLRWHRILDPIRHRHPHTTARRRITMSPLVTYQLKDSIATMTMDDGKVEHRFFRRWFFAFCDELLWAPHAASA